METKDGARLELVLKQLESQYKVYRAEIRSYNQIAAGSASLLVLLLFGELAAAKDNPSMYFLIPLSVISYSAVLGNIATFGHMAGFYTALLERKINELVKVNNLYQYEHDYVGPYIGHRKHGSETLQFLLVFTILPSLMPVLLSVYALYKLWGYHEKTAYVLGGAFLITFYFTITSMKKIFRTREEWNEDIVEKWKETIKTM